MKAVELSKSKLWATKNLSPASSLRQVMLLEKDLMTPYEYLAKIGNWLKLAQVEESTSKRGPQYG